MEFSEIFLETVETLNGISRVRRVKTSFILVCGLSFIPLGVYLFIALKQHCLEMDSKSIWKTQKRKT
jgi:hypothetical protein